MMSEVLLKPGQDLILVIFQVAALLAAFIRTSHIVFYAPSDSFTCRLAAPRII